VCKISNCSHTPSSSVGEREKTEGSVAGSRSMTGRRESSRSRALCGAVAEGKHGCLGQWLGRGETYLGFALGSELSRHRGRV
jgi:hypothetical protein